jgi:hypothetical protein
MKTLALADGGFAERALGDVQMLLMKPLGHPVV